MKLSKFCDETLVNFGLKTTEKDGVIEELVELVSHSNMVKDSDQLLKDIKERENLVTTGVGYGV
ncbi:MAG: PTS sugar transporter subunit IIA, partial [candidate division Zixibacteria bacterium]|nr:PTS sugar transporter subunit IIA [candidate division Zixibacteria bacterium]